MIKGFLNEPNWGHYLSGQGILSNFSRITCLECCLSINQLEIVTFVHHAALTKRYVRDYFYYEMSKNQISSFIVFTSIVDHTLERTWNGTEQRKGIFWGN